jgi:elongation factor 1 alpha-like protein
VSGGGGGGGGGSSSSPVAEFVPHPSDVAAFAAAPRRLHLVVLGHVDAGKSTLMGRLMHASGAVTEKERRANQKDADAAGKASFSWAFALDSRPEERERGVTVDVAQASIETGKTSVTLLDAPGHEDFVPNAISGMARADAAVLVIDAAPGAFEKGFPALGSDAASRSDPSSGTSWSPSRSSVDRRGGGVGQTREHAELARSLGVRHLIVAVNKMDRCGYDATRFAAIRSALEPFLLGGCAGEGESAGARARAGFETIAWVPTSGAEGVNLIRDRSSAESSSSRGSHSNAPPITPLPAALASWYALDRPSLVDAIDAVPSDASDDGKNKPLRFVAFDVSDGSGSHARGTSASSRGGCARALGNAVVGGKIVAGVLRKGQRVAIVPAGVVATVRAIEATGGGAAKARGGDAFVAGDAVDVGLDGLDGGIDGVVAPGSVLCDPAFPARACVAFEALIDTRSTVRVPILAGTRVELFVGGARAEARVASLLELVDPESTDKVVKTRPRCLTKNQRARVRIEVVGEEKGVCVERAEACDALGRVALRVGGKTVAAGTVTETE